MGISLEHRIINSVNIIISGDKLDENDKKNINEKLDALKKAKDSGDSELIKSSMESLNTVWSGLAQKIYEPGEQNPNPGPSDNKDSSKKSRKKEEGKSKIFWAFESVIYNSPFSKLPSK